MSVDARIIDAIENDNHTTWQIAKFVNSSQDYVRRRLKKMVADGRVVEEVDRAQNSYKLNG